MIMTLMRFCKPIMGSWNRLFLSLFLLLSLCNRLYCQNIGGGIYAGLTASQVDGDGLQGFDLPGANLGFLAKVKIGQKSDVKLELAFVQKGSRVPFSDSTNFYKLRLNYIEVPLVYEYHWKDLSFEIGLGADILVNKKEEDIYGPRESSLDYYTFNLVGLFGVSYYFTDNWALNFRTNNSITNISNGRRGVVSPLSSWIGPYGQRNDALSFALIYYFKRD